MALPKETGEAAAEKGERFCNQRSPEDSGSHLRLHGLLPPAGHEDAHAALVAEVRSAHRRKRNLMRMLDAQPWPAPSP